MSDTPLFAEDILPSRECTDCPKAACLEFTVVDYWGDPVDSPTQFTLDGTPASPDTPIQQLTLGSHMLKALDGQVQLPYSPARGKGSPAEAKARREGKKYILAGESQLWTQIPLQAGMVKCREYLIEVNLGIDYCILMAFLDNHSGGLHGTGHAGAVIIDGRQNQWMYTDFGPYENDLGEVRSTIEKSNLVSKQFGKIDEEALGTVFNDLNKSHGSGMSSSKPCYLHETLNGPDHEHFGTNNLPRGFAINGIIAWAAFALPAGAYKRMREYAKREEARMDHLRNLNQNGYSVSFNCMTYAVSVLNTGLGEPLPAATGKVFDHPNAHIGSYMAKAHEQGYFDNRMFLGKPESVSKQQQKQTAGARQRKSIQWAVCRKQHTPAYDSWSYY